MFHDSINKADYYNLNLKEKLNQTTMVFKDKKMEFYNDQIFTLRTFIINIDSIIQHDILSCEHQGYMYVLNVTNKIMEYRKDQKKAVKKIEKIEAKIVALKHS